MTNSLVLWEYLARLLDLHLVCDLNIGKNLSCDSRAYIMDFCNRSLAKTYTRDESFLECETRCPESVCMQMFLFKKWKLSHNAVNNGGSINMMHHKNCFFQEQLDTDTGSTGDTTNHVEKEPFKIGFKVFCLTVTSLIMIVYLVHVIYLYKNRNNKLKKRYSSQTEELETEFPTEESDNTTVKRPNWTPRMQDRRSFPNYDKLRYIDSEEN
ncbi:hypothetical protein ACJMK2_037037 [Sinanodonta woodiana]|uniref:Uncharacterized protein n=1 Tax=Sinanodonta woodiana TaxID=1069815 RepID=A0ABD3WL42_SINWO